MPQLQAVTLRLPLIQGSRDKIVDKLSNKIPAFPRGNGVLLQCAAFLRDPSASSLVNDLSNIAAITMQCRADSALGDPIFDKTVAIEDFDNPALTWADWDANASQHLSIPLTATETGQDLGGKAEKKIYIAFEALPLVGDPIFLGSINTIIFEDGIGSSGDPVVGDPTYLNAAEIAALYGQRGINTPDFRPAFTSRTGGTAADADSLATTALAAGYWLSFEPTGEGLRNFRLRAGTAAPALPGIFRPADYAETTNEKYWEAV
jgi:hypothetical protein